MANMLYNGVELPDIDSIWEQVGKTAYPYVLFSTGTNPNGTTGTMYFVAKELVHKTDGLYPADGGSNGYYHAYYTGGTSWSGPNGPYNDGAGVCFASDKYHNWAWSNSEILNVDGSVFLTASEPVDPNAPAEPDTPHITTSSGDGFALYNGVKLPKLPEWDKSIYPHSFISSNGDRYTLFVFDGSGASYDSSANEVKVRGTKRIYYSLLSDGTWSGVEQDFSVFRLDQSLYPVIWTNRSIGDYLAASEPIPLDGMNVIEWDGDTTGLEVSLTGAHYRVADYVDPSSAIVVYHTELDNSEPYVVKTDLVHEEDGLWTIGEGMYAMGTDGTDVEYGKSGIYFINMSGADTYHVTLFAYPTSGGGDSTYDRMAFLSGMAMGLTGKGNPTSDMVVSGGGGGASGNMLYNGVKLPDIDSVWTDKEAYPYAYILYVPLDDVYLFAAASVVSSVIDNNLLYSSNGNAFGYVYFGADSWVFETEDHVIAGEGYGFEGFEIVWSSYDILNSDNSVYLAASDPVPAGGTDTFVKGYKVGAALRRKRVLPDFN